MTVIPGYIDLIDETDSAVKLARYAQLIGLSEDQFFGLNNSATLVEASCHPIWTLRERQRIAKYLKEAQDEIEQVVGYFLNRRWVIGERHPYGYPVHTDWGKVVDGGFRTTANIQLGAAPNYATDSAIVGPIATTVTDEDEIHVFHPGTTVEIYPSHITLAGGNVTIYIPWARLVKLPYSDNPETGLTYADVPPSVTSPYEATVDVKRVYHEDAIQGGVIWPHRTNIDCTCACDACCGTCGEYAASACIYVRNSETGALDLIPASHSATGWTPACSTCYCEEPTTVELNYRSGLEAITLQLEDAVVRLGHAKMPSPPCGCGLVQEMWTRDRNVPDVLTSERLNCPFGLSDGAWVAWKFALAARLQKGLALG